MSLSQKFVDEYCKLNQEREAGDGIWRLCEMSAMVVAPRGKTEQRNKQQDGITRELSDKSLCSVDTIERRAFAWREWVRFQECDLYDEEGREIDYDHRQVRDRLFYSHFAELGRMVEAGKIENADAMLMLVMAVRDRYSVSKMIGAINILLDVKDNFELDVWEPFADKTIGLLSYPEIVGRRRRLIQELVGTDWAAKEKL